MYLYTDMNNNWSRDQIKSSQKRFMVQLIMYIPYLFLNINNNET